ncbi:MAG: hypothetical protein WC836_18785 [Desulfobacula sp.]|jgi:hypothetical protein
MINIYFDERIEESYVSVRFIISSFLLSESKIENLRNDFRKIMGAKRKRKVEALTAFIEDWQSMAVITYADIPQNLAKAGEIDGTKDIPKMKRRDNIWAQCVLYNLAKMLGKIGRSGAPMDNINIFFDPKSLPQFLNDVFQNYILTRIPKILRPSIIYFKQLEFVQKSRDISNATQEQIGISISDHLMKSFSELIEDENLNRIFVENQTADVIEGLKPFI